MAPPLTPKDLLERLKPGETPILLHTKQALLALRKRRETLSATQLARVVLADPLATLRVIHQANQRPTRSLSGEIATVEAALIMQGVGPFLDQAATLPTLEIVMKDAPGSALGSVYRLLRLAQHAAWQARDFAVQGADTRAEEVEVAALLYYIPDLLFWIQARDVARALARLRRRMHYEQAEKSVLGFPLGELRQTMLAAWKIPSATRELLAAAAEDNRARQLKACLDIAHYSRQGWWDERLPDIYANLALRVGAQVDEVIATTHINAVKAARLAAWNRSPPSAAWLPMLPGPWPNEEVDDDEDEHPPGRAIASAQPTSGAAAAPGPRARAPSAAREAGAAVCAMPDTRVFKESLRAIELHLDGSFTLNQMSAQILRGLHTGLGLSRLLFAMVTPDGKRVKCRFSLGIAASDPLRHFEFPLASPDLFGHLVAKPQGLWLNADNRARLWPKVDARLRAMIGEGDFYAMSLFNGAKPIGLIYADRGHGDCGLDAHSYTDFKMFCLQAARGLSRVKD
jgi:hypothetical protein